MGQFYSGADIKKLALQRAGEPTDGTSPYDTLALTYANQLYFNIVGGSSEFDVDCGEAWAWARSASPLILTLLPSITAGSIAITSGSTAGVFSTIPTISLKDQYLKVSDNPEHYRISEHTAGDANFVLDGPYNGSTDAAASYEVKMLTYELGSEEDVLKLVEPFRVYKRTFDEDLNYQVFGLDSNSFNTHYPLASSVGGIPNRFMVFKNAENKLCARFNQWVSEATRVEIDFFPPPAELLDRDDSLPIMPREFRAALAYGSAFQILTDKNDDKATRFFQLAQMSLKALVQAARKEQSQVNSKSKGKIEPRQEYIRVRQRLNSFIRQN